MKEPLKISNHSQFLGGFSFFFFLFSLMRVVLNAHFSTVIKVPVAELCVVFWEIPIPGCVSTVLGKLLSLGCWSYFS